MRLNELIERLQKARAEIGRNVEVSTDTDRHDEELDYDIIDIRICASEVKIII